MSACALRFLVFIPDRFEPFRFTQTLLFFTDAAVYQRDELGTGDCLDGPAVIIERETSTVVTSRYRAVRQADGCLLLTRKEEG